MIANTKSESLHVAEIDWYDTIWCINCAVRVFNGSLKESLGRPHFPVYYGMVFFLAW